MNKHTAFVSLALDDLSRTVGGAAPVDSETARENRRAYHKPASWIDTLPKGPKGIQFDNPTVDVSGVDDRRSARCKASGNC